MLGRAGRPQFDEKGVGIIMTQDVHRSKFLDLCNGQLPVESVMRNYLMEHLNAEISVGTVVDRDTAISWLKNTFLCVRIKKDARRYGIEPGSGNLEHWASVTSVNLLTSLESSSMITYQNDKIFSSKLGKLMARFYLSLETMSLMLNSFEHQHNEKEVLQMICKAREFQDFEFQAGEKKCLNSINKNLKYPLSGKIKTIDDKIFLLVQTTLGSIPLSFNSLNNILPRILQFFEKILNCLVDLGLEHFRCTTLACVAIKL
jgi:ATP-dependent DNA helicase HFM1/MER3